MQIENDVYANIMRYAYEFAKDSPDPSTQNGAVIVNEILIGDHFGFEVLAHGCNTFTKGVKCSPEKLERPLKYSYIEHAERNCIYHAASQGVCLTGKTMICPWAACIDCARAIIQSGITKLVRHKDASDRSPERWIESIAIADELFVASDIEIVEFTGVLHEMSSVAGVVPTIMHCEEEWTP